MQGTWLITEGGSKSSQEPLFSPAGSLEAGPWGFNDELRSAAEKREAFPRDLQYLVKDAT